MDYHALAEQLMDLHVLLHQSPAGRQLEDLDRGTSLALGYLMAHHKMAHPKELGRGMAVSSARVAALLAQVLERLGPEDAAAYLRLRKKLIEALPEA